jgi:hypothetical protein
MHLADDLVRSGEARAGLRALSDAAELLHGHLSQTDPSGPTLLDEGVVAGILTRLEQLIDGVSTPASAEDDVQTLFVLSTEAERIGAIAGVTDS